MSVEPKMAEGRSLFERLGGEAAIEAAVVRFYDKVIADPLTAPFFARLDLPTHIRKQISFMARAFGAPKAYQGRDLRVAHRKLVQEDGLSDAHFDAVAGHLNRRSRSWASPTT